MFLAGTGACAVPTSTAAPTATLSATAATIAASSPTATPQLKPQQQPELTEAAEAWHWLSSQGDQVWPGWGTTRLPLLVRAGEFDLLVGHPSPPQEFGLLPDWKTRALSERLAREDLLQEALR